MKEDWLFLRRLQRSMHEPRHRLPELTPRASVAIVLRVQPTTESTTTTDERIADIPSTMTTMTMPSSSSGSSSSEADDFATFLELPWVKTGRVEIGFILRAVNPADRWSGQVGFPGGRNQGGHESDRDTCLREVREEIGLDLTQGYIPVGEMDHRRINLMFSKELLICIVPFVFIQRSPVSPTPTLAPSEVTAWIWVPLEYFRSPTLSQVTMNLALLVPWLNSIPEALRRWMLLERYYFVSVVLPWKENKYALAPPSTTTTTAAAETTGDDFPAALVKGELPELKLWGLTMHMLIDFLRIGNLTTPILGMWTDSPDVSAVLSFLHFTKIAGVPPDQSMAKLMKISVTSALLFRATVAGGLLWLLLSPKQSRL